MTLGRWGSPTWVKRGNDFGVMTPHLMVLLLELQENTRTR